MYPIGSSPNKLESIMLVRSEIYFLMKLVEKSEVPAWINKEQLLFTLQEAWIESIHNEKKEVVNA